MNAHKPGYKHTSLGWIPEDWEIKRLSKLVSLISGMHLNPDEYNKDGSGIPYFTGPTDYTNSAEELTKWTNKQSSFSIAGDILITVKGSGVGSLHCLSLPKVSIGRQIMSIRENGESDNLFIYQNLILKSYRFRELAKGNMIPGLTRDDILSTEILTPKVREQRKIATVLNAWDEAIQKTQQLIEQLKQRNKGLMQQLLTGKKRLKGFGGIWKNVLLEDVTTKISRRNGELVDAKVYSVTNSNGFVLQSDHFEREVAGADLSNYKIIKTNEFAYNPARINVGSIAYFTEPVGIISSLYVCFKTKPTLLDMFLWYLLDLDLTKHRIISLGEGGVRVYLWYDLFGKIKIALPTIEEQDAIMKILTVADDELKLYQQQLGTLQQQKKGLMQKLLSGEVRVKI